MTDCHDDLRQIHSTKIQLYLQAKKRVARSAGIDRAGRGRGVSGDANELNPGPRCPARYDRGHVDPGNATIQRRDFIGVIHLRGIAIGGENPYTPTPGPKSPWARSLAGREGRTHLRAEQAGAGTSQLVKSPGLRLPNCSRPRPFQTILNGLADDCFML